MKKTYTTKLIKNKTETNLSFTVPLALILQSKTQRRSPWQWTDIFEEGALMLVPFIGSHDEALERAKVYGDVVLLQRMLRKIGNPQYKVNLPRWIYKDKGLADVERVSMGWDLTPNDEIYGRIEIPTLV